jgi:hypothetical protein
MPLAPLLAPLGSTVLPQRTGAAASANAIVDLCYISAAAALAVAQLQPAIAERGMRTPLRIASPASAGARGALEWVELKSGRGIPRMFLNHAPRIVIRQFSACRIAAEVASHRRAAQVAWPVL